ncbi:MAG TPA: Na/Pi cotransporter family protein [Verrucomicrobiales bacterium]|nr:Na/Pi cotransporter family protein [Verrucomicrobiales bacterium]
MKNEKLLTLLKILGVGVCLYLFLIGIGGMGAAFKGEFKDTAAKLLEATQSPIVGLFIGILATTIVQSSSTTTSLIVGLVAAGAVDVGGAIFMVMGANVGTTVTAKIVSLGHITRKAEFRRAFAASSVHDTFNFITVAILLPLEYSFHILEKGARFLGEHFVRISGVTKPENYLKKITKPLIDWMDAMLSDPALLVVSIVITFFMLFAIVKLLQSLVLKKLEAFFDAYLFRNAAIAFMVGLCLTVLVQSSSITTSLIVPLAGAGVLRLPQIFPFTIGANIGTTVTGLLAALAAGSAATVQSGPDLPPLVVAGATVAFAHLLFNLAGALIFLPFAPIRALPVKFAEWLAELCLRNRVIPIVIIVLVFYIIPLVVTWSTIAAAFKKE